MAKPNIKLPEPNAIPETAPEPPNDFAKAFRERIGIKTEDLAKIFKRDANDQPDPKSPIGKLYAHIRGRVSDGIKQSLRNWQAWYALDEAWKVSFGQVTPTLMRRILSNDKIISVDQIAKELTKWGLNENEVFIKIRTPDGRDEKILRDTTFVKLMLPIVKGVVLSRASKIYNDRFGNEPMLNFQMVGSSAEDDIVGKVVTGICNEMVNSYGYRDLGRVLIIHALKYTYAFTFPTEVWHVEWERDPDGKPRPKREGLRYSIPHPTRCAWDQNYRPSTFNTDTGCEWACYWEVKRYGDLVCSPILWNTEQISYGTDWWRNRDYYCDQYFTQAYPCHITPPVFDESVVPEHKFYSESDYDKAVIVTNLYCKLIPKQWGLGDYEHPLWFWFMIGSDDTVLWADYFPYHPVLCYCADADEGFGRTANSSLALDALPFQDMASIAVSNYILAVKQNLRKIIAYDSDQAPNDIINSMERQVNELEYITWLPFSARQNLAERADPTKIFFPINLGMQNSVEVLGCLRTVLDMLERILQMSAQEVGTIAGHVQTAEEIRSIRGYTGLRTEMTSAPLDSWIDAFKHQIWTAAREFRDNRFSVPIRRVDEKLVSALKTKYGFEIEAGPGDTVIITGDKSRIPVGRLITSREGNRLLSSEKLAAIMWQTIQIVSQNQILAGRLGPEWFARLIERAAKFSGAPEDFAIEISKEATTLVEMKAVAGQLEKNAKQIAEIATQKAEQDLSKLIGESMNKQAGAISQAQEAVAATASEVAAVKQATLETAQELAMLKETIARIEQIVSAAAQPEPLPTAGFQ